MSQRKRRRKTVEASIAEIKLSSLGILAMIYELLASLRLHTQEEGVGRKAHKFNPLVSSVHPSVVGRRRVDERVGWLNDAGNDCVVFIPSNTQVHPRDKSYKTKRERVHNTPRGTGDAQQLSQRQIGSASLVEWRVNRKWLICIKKHFRSSVFPNRPRSSSTWECFRNPIS
ncbi:hypothetical protein BLNAU_17024 [Blattamonas nauphoetae]|uniref:Transposase n=1 Tax=Blattamonas nauphoetae TaxID=2049346 RepID=A0ABQ9XA03_9EUKA|nr:hypothetical protein BLNAU_17024 [Blattamonas nauphoetae]